jgi:hypothetical protein
LLPHGHPFILLILNNRAAARLKTGNHKECVDDCSQVIQCCKETTDRSHLTPAEQKEIKATLLKALIRRANAYESIEKWDSAKRDYQEVFQINPSMKMATEGIRRCNKVMGKTSLGGEKTVISTHSIQPASWDVRIGPSAMNSATTVADDLRLLVSDPSLNTKNGTSPESQRVQELRKQNHAKVQEETEKFRLKDDIDAKASYNISFH